MMDPYRTPLGAAYMDSTGQNGPHGRDQPGTHSHTSDPDHTHSQATHGDGTTPHPGVDALRVDGAHTHARTRRGDGPQSSAHVICDAYLDADDRFFAYHAQFVSGSRMAKLEGVTAKMIDSFFRATQVIRTDRRFGGKIRMRVVGTFVIDFV